VLKNIAGLLKFYIFPRSFLALRAVEKKWVKAMAEEVCGGRAAAGESAINANGNSQCFVCSADRAWTFRVKCPKGTLVGPGEVVCVTGSPLALGEWRAEACLTLALEDGEDGGHVWSGTTRLPQGVEVHFRYCVCLRVPAKNKQEVEAPVFVARRWEATIKPRKIGSHGTFYIKSTVCTHSSSKVRVS